MAKHGCCADKACTAGTCMELPAGKTCGDCVHTRRCVLMFGHQAGDTYCDWFPRRFREKAPEVAPAEAKETAGLPPSYGTDLDEALSNRPWLGGDRG